MALAEQVWGAVLGGFFKGVSVSASDVLSEEFDGLRRNDMT